jgi:hypothetical protein
LDSVPKLKDREAIHAAISSQNMLHPSMLVEKRPRDTNPKLKTNLCCSLRKPTTIYLSSFLRNVLVLRINFLYLCFFIFNLLCLFTLMAYIFLLSPGLFP